MKALLISSFVLSILAISSLLLFQPQQVNGTAFVWNNTQITFPLTAVPRHGSDVFLSSGNNGTINQWWYQSYEQQFFTLMLGGKTSGINPGPSLTPTLDNEVGGTAQTLSYTVHTHNNETLIVSIQDYMLSTTRCETNDYVVASVTYGAASLTKLVNSTKTYQSDCTTGRGVTTEVWYLKNPTVGSASITVTPTKPAYTHHYTIDAYAMYNLDPTTPFGSTVTTNNNTSTMKIKPTHTGAWVFGQLTAAGITAHTQSEMFNNGNTFVIEGQYNSNPTINSANTLSWTATCPDCIGVGYEIEPAYNTASPSNTLYINCLTTSTTPNSIGNHDNLYYACNQSVNHVNVNNGTTKHDFTAPATPTKLDLFSTIKDPIVSWDFTGATNYISTRTANITTTDTTSAPSVYTNQNIGVNGVNLLRYNLNTTSPLLVSNSNYVPTTGCGILYAPNNFTINIDSIACDITIPANVTRYWDGLSISRQADMWVNSTLPFLTSINTYPTQYRQILSLPCIVLGVPDPCSTFILHANNVNYLIVLTTNTIYYGNMQTIQQILNHNYAMQSYLLTTLNTNTDDNVPFITAGSSTGTYQNEGNNVVQIINTQGGFNKTMSKLGMFSLPSGYYAKTFVNTISGIRTIDPQWQNDANEYPIYATNTTALYPVFLTVSNAPTNAAVIVSNPYTVINGFNDYWAAAQLDSTHSIEFDIPPNQCPNVYVGDNSVTPVVYTYEGNVCASGVNQKTITYTNTLPLTFYTMKYGATSSFTPNTNALTTTVRSTVTPFTYNVIIRNSTGSIITNFTNTANVTTDSHIFNVSNTAKPGAVFISIPGTGTIYSAYLGSALSFASTVSFFHQYFNYQGFDLLSFIPIIFAAMFTRNTVGIGMSMVVVVIATLSFLSVVVISDATMGIIVVIALIGMIGYRSYYG